MAEKKNTQQGDIGTTRRGFIGAIGAAVAASALPAAALGASPNAPTSLAEWHAAFGELVERFRPTYMAEVVRLAETLRPRFESGELRGFTDDDLEDGENGATSPMWKVEAAAGEHFRLTKGRQVEDAKPCEGSEHIAHMILAVSPSAPYVTGDGWRHVAYEATDAAMWDVILYARGQGWYAPDSTEEMGPNVKASRTIAARGE